MHLTRIVLYDIRMVQEEQDQKRVQPSIKNFQNNAEKPRNPAADLCHQLLVVSCRAMLQILKNMWI